MANKLGSIKICHMTVEVIESTAREHPQLDGNYGYCDAEGQKIFVEQGLSSEMFRETLIHEIRHFVWSAGGIRYFTATALGMEPGGQKVADFEETLLRLETLHLIAALQELKKLKGMSK